MNSNVSTHQAPSAFSLPERFSRLINFGAHDPRLMLPRVLLKTLALFAVINVVFMLLYPVLTLDRISVYNTLVPGRQRLPVSNAAGNTYNLGLYRVEQMFSTHEINGAPKAGDEFRVLVFGDSGTWGSLLRPEETLAGQINALGLSVKDGRKVKAFNLAYPETTAIKDLVLMHYAMRYQPDMIVWPLTLEAFPNDYRWYHPIVKNNPDVMRDLITNYGLQRDISEIYDVRRLDRTLVGRRHEMADMLRMQFYGLMWGATGIDTPYEHERQPANDLEANPNYLTMKPPALSEADLAFNALDVARNVAGDVPILLVNEPMYVADGTNSDIRYNKFYPRWAFDQFRPMFAEQASRIGADYIDLWNFIAPDQFTDTELHITPAAMKQYAQEVGRRIALR
jgi:hypothetical protein